MSSETHDSDEEIVKNVDCKERKKRGSVACDACRGLKIRCDGGTPCGSCNKAGRLCVYSPKKKRGPTPKVVVIDEKAVKEQKVQHSSSFVVVQHLQGLLHYFAQKFQGDFLIVNEESVTDKTLSKTGKLQLFAALACSARSGRNMAFAERLYQHGTQVARELYDDMNTETSLSTAFGFFLLANAACTFDYPKLKFFLRICYTIVNSREDPRPTSKILQSFLTRVYFCLSPHEYLATLLFPNMASFKHDPSIRNSEVSLSLMANFFSAQLIETMENWMNATEKLEANAKCYSLVRAIISYYDPVVVSIYQCEEFEEFHTKIQPSYVPKIIAKQIITLLQAVLEHEGNKGGFIPFIYTWTYISFVYAAVADHKNTLKYTTSVGRLCNIPDHHYKGICTTSCTIGPCCFICALLLLKQGCVAEAKDLLETMQIIGSMGFKNCKSGYILLKGMIEKGIFKQPNEPNLASGFSVTALTSNSNPSHIFNAYSSVNTSASHQKDSQSSAKTLNHPPPPASNPGPFPSTSISTHFSSVPIISTNFQMNPTTPNPNYFPDQNFFANNHQGNSYSTLSTPTILPHEDNFEPFPLLSSIEESAQFNILQPSLPASSTNPRLKDEKSSMDALFSFWDEGNEEGIMEDLKSLMEQ